VIQSGWTLLKEDNVVTYCVQTSMFDCSKVGIRSRVNLTIADHWELPEWHDLMSASEHPMPELQELFYGPGFQCVKIHKEEVGARLSVHEEAKVVGRTGPKITVSYSKIRELEIAA
jgi:hypothetical protein